ncbi:MAG: glycine reductase [SAR202 cluster bacterium Io17-Chloro-G9]|nr:MAG: glycine reductase [SAR202 cluster bacterium Io17-Chloro-G9]
MIDSTKQPVILGVRYFLAHTPGLVRHGSKPSRDLLANPGLLPSLTSHLRSFPEAVAYPPHRVFLGDVYPDDLEHLPRPWYQVAGQDSRWNPHGEIMPEEEFYALLKIADDFDLLWLEEEFTRDAAAALADHPLISDSDVKKLGAGFALSAIESQIADAASALPIILRDGRLIGCVNRAHQQDATLTPDVLLENLACKASAAMAFRTLLSQSLDSRTSPESEGLAESIDYVINSGEEAVGERYQRGGGNLGKAVAEMCGCVNATGADVKAFCCGPVHALVMAGALVNAGVYKKVAVVAGCSLAKLGMKYEGHLGLDQPVLEDVLAGMAFLVGEDDGVSPRLRLDSVGRHSVGAGSSQQAIFRCLVSEPLVRLGLRYQDVDKYATELHNPELTEPSGSGNVPLLNYRLIAGMATLEEQISKADIPSFVQRHGMPGFSPTQGHIASAVPFLGHAWDRLVAGEMQRSLFLAKGSLFLGRMTQLSDGMSFILERNN